MEWYQILSTVYVEGVIIAFVYRWVDYKLLGYHPEIAWKSLLVNSLEWPRDALCFLLLPFSKKAREGFDTIRRMRRVMRRMKQEAGIEKK